MVIKSPTYRTWYMMKYRCSTPTYNLYKYYGGKGVQVCDKWETIEGFIEDMGERPAGMTLDRIDSNGNYCKENCRWATMKTQSENKVSSLSYELNGEVRNLNEWAEIAGTTRARLYNHMWRDKSLSLRDTFEKLGMLERVTDYQTGGALVW